MTDGPLAVLALDAADYDLARRWDCDNLLLDAHTPLETFTYSLDHPFTPEVWTTVATGVHPREHGVSGDAQEWQHPALRLASTVTQHLPPHVRQALGRPFRSRGADQSFNQTDLPHAFDATLGWPGLTPAPHLDAAWTDIDLAESGDLTDAELRQRSRERTGKEFGWLAAMSTAGGGFVGVHSHILDAAGHVWADDGDALREAYEWTDAFVGWLRVQVDRLVILSDHGMQTTVTDDPDPGVHSMRSYVAAQGVDGSLPESVFDVRDFLDERRGEADGPLFGVDEALDVAATREHLAGLGYLEA